MVKHTQTIRFLPTNRLSVVDHFVGLALKPLILMLPQRDFMRCLIVTKSFMNHKAPNCCMIFFFFLLTLKHIPIQNEK